MQLTLEKLENIAAPELSAAADQDYTFGALVGAGLAILLFLLL